jgi:hypothetical protein
LNAAEASGQRIAEATKEQDKMNAGPATLDSRTAWVVASAALAILTI